MPQFTVAIPTYNRAGFLTETLSCLHRQSHQDFDIVISDNASTDNTTEVVHRFSDARTRYIRQPELIGAVENWMACADMAQTDWIVFNQDDDFLSPMFLERAARAIRQHPDIVMYAADVLCSTDADRFSGGTFGGFPLRHRWDVPQPRVIPGIQVATLNWFMTGFMPPAQAMPTHLFRKHWYVGENAMIIGGDHHLTAHLACEGNVAYESFIGAIIRHHSQRACVIFADKLRQSREAQCRYLQKLFAEKKLDWQSAFRAILPELSLEFREQNLMLYMDDDLLPPEVLAILTESIAAERGISAADVVLPFRAKKLEAVSGGRLERIGMPRPIVRALRRVFSALGKRY